MKPLLWRIAEFGEKTGPPPGRERQDARGRQRIEFVLDGRPAIAIEGDTVLTAILTQAASLRVNEFSGSPRAGFCLMGACQDCWVATEGGEHLRSCSTFIENGMRLVTGSAK